MTDSSTQNFFHEPDNANSSATEEQVLAELYDLLNSNEPVTSSNSNINNRAIEEDVLATIRDLLLQESTTDVNYNSSQPLVDNNQALVTEEDDLAAIRQLLFPEHNQLSQLQQRLDNPKVYAEELSRVLPEAIILRSIQADEQLTKSLLPTIEQAIQISVKKDINVLANAIFPVIGPAIRKSISVTLNTLIQSLNQSLEHSLSPQSFKWRLEARQTGKSFAEVVLLRTLVYRVEQVFLIHKETGLVLQHVVAPAVAAQDADLVSAMLRAIQDFVKDSFNVSQDESLDTLHFGELTIWIEQAPLAIVAGVIRGNAPQELRSVFQNVIEKIHNEQSSELSSFKGENAPFEASRDYLEVCLQSQYAIKAEKKFRSPILWILAGGILFILGLWAFISIQERQRWLTYLEQLNTQPGIVVINAQKQHGKYFISGMRDPLATDPIKLMQAAKINPETVISRWEPYLSFDAKFITTRAKQLLQPPKTVALKVEEGILYATGSAPRQWISQAQKVAITIPGITQFYTEDLIEADFKQVQLSKEKIENQLLYFVNESTQLVPNQAHKLQTLVNEIEKLSDSAPFYNMAVHIQIIGHTDDNGAEDKNLILGQARAYTILSTLVSKGIKETNLTAVGVGTREPLSRNLTLNKALSRRVSFKVYLTEAVTRR